MQVRDRQQGSSLTTYPLPPAAQPFLRSAHDFLLTHHLDVGEPTLEIRILAGGSWRYVEEALNRLLSLEAGWNGYRSRRVTQAAVIAAINVLENVLDEQSLPPQMFPLPDGGVQLEWRVAGDSVEVQIDASGDSDVIGERANGEELLEGDLTPDTLRQLRKVVDEMSWRVMSGR